MSEAMQPGPLADLDILALKLCLIQSAVEFVLHVISMFVASTMTASLELTLYLIELSTSGIDPPNVERSIINVNLFNDIVSRLNYLIGDAIVVRRAWVLWNNHPRVHMLLVEIKQNLGLSHNKKTKVERVLILLTESGSIYCLLWLSLLVFHLKSSDKESLAYIVIISTVPLLVAIYPIITILLLAFQKTNLESTVNGPSFSQSLQFASRPQVPTATQSDDVTPDSTTSHINSVMPDPATNDRLDPTTDNRSDSNTNDTAVVEKANLESTVAGPSFSQSLQFASRHQVPTATQSDDVAPGSTTSHINSVMPDSDTDERSEPATDDRLDPTMYNRPDSKTNDTAVAESLGEKMEKHGSSHFG
ncbi:hypothetical protein C8J56DRAFT_1131928 [Mycena floridula]|nr:hypothetical protein C8J56DRAFT_1131928 [Mycena floridula]